MNILNPFRYETCQDDPLWQEKDRLTRTGSTEMKRWDAGHRREDIERFYATRNRQKDRVIEALRESPLVWNAYSDCDLTKSQYEALARDIMTKIASRP